MLRWVGSIAAILILVALFGIWRLMQGPIELNWLGPYVEAAITRSGIGLKVAVSGVRLGIDRQTHQLDLLAENVRVSQPDGVPVARFPELATSFALGQILRGRLAPTRVAVERPVVHLVRDAAGSISAQIGSGNDTGPALGPAMLEELAGPRQPDAPLGLLRRLDIRGATVIVDDRASGRTWRANRVDFAINRGRKGVRGDFSLAVPLGNSMPELHVNYRYFAARQVLDLEAAVDGVQPAQIPPLTPELVQLQHVDAPVSGTLRTRIDLKAQRAQGARIDLALGKGWLHSSWLPNDAVAIDKGELHVIYAPETETVRLDGMTLDLGAGAQLAMAGTLAGITPELMAGAVGKVSAAPLTAKISAALTHVPVARFASLWPLALSPGGRRWTIANVHDGVLDDGSVQLALAIDPATHRVDVQNATGGLRYHNLTINYFDGLPPVRQVDGTAKFAGDQLDFMPTAGSLKRLKVTGGHLLVSHLGQHTEWLTIDVDTVGPLRDALEIIDMKPLHYAHAVGLDPAQVSGRAETRLHFNFPLLSDLKIAQVQYGAKATITGADLGKVVMHRAVTDGNFALDLGGAGAHVRGTARFDGIPTRLDANVYFHPQKGPRALYRVGLTLDDAALHRLDLDFAPDRLKGPIAADVTYATFAGDRSEATALLNLTDAALAIPEAGWNKPPAQPGTAKIVLDLEHDKLARMPDIEVRAAGLAGKFSAWLGPDERLQRVDIAGLTVGQSSMSGTVTRRVGGGWRADIRASQLDAHHLIKDATGDTRASPSPPLAVNAHIDRLLFGPGRELRQVNASLLRTGGNWRTGRIDGSYPNGRRLDLRFGENGGNRLALQSDDLGNTLKLLDITDDVVGGQVTISGQFSETGARRVLSARLDGRNYSVVRAPWMAKLLALPSLTGLASALTGTGLPFMMLRGDFTYGGGRLGLQRLLAYGESLGVTAKGWVDVDHDRLDLQGTVAPAYALNSIIGNVPIVGPLFGGGDQGLFAANFRLSGPSADPRVSVNPLSALAPGFLRQLFPPLSTFSTK